MGIDLGPSGDFAIPKLSSLGISLVLNSIADIFGIRFSKSKRMTMNQK